MKYITLLIYLGLGLLHLFLVIDIPFLLVLVGLFEIVRLVAVHQKIRLVVGVLAVFSSAFIVVNYSNMYANNKSNIDGNNQINQTINSYVNKHWVNQDTFKTLIEKQENNIKNIVNLPNQIIVATLVSLIELSMAYMVCFSKENKNVESKRFFTKPNNNESIDSNERKPNININRNDSSCNSNSIKKLEIINGEYFVNNLKVGRTKYFAEKRKAKEVR